MRVPDDMLAKMKACRERWLEARGLLREIQAWLKAHLPGVESFAWRDDPFEWFGNVRGDSLVSIFHYGEEGERFAVVREDGSVEIISARDYLYGGEEGSTAP